jgi:hypothetical protein
VTTEGAYPVVPKRRASICNNCGEVVERTDDGRYWHVEGMDGYDRCRLFAEPVEEFA